MATSRGSDHQRDKSSVYQIRIQGHLDRQWADRFEEFSIVLEDNGTTLLTGPVADQAALHGILRRVRDLGITLIAVNTVDLNLDDPSKTQVSSRADGE